MPALRKISISADELMSLLSEHSRKNTARMLGVHPDTVTAEILRNTSTRKMYKSVEMVGALEKKVDSMVKAVIFEKRKLERIESMNRKTVKKLNGGAKCKSKQATLK